MVFICSNCKKCFEKKYDYENHCSRKIPCKPVDEKLTCTYCTQRFTMKKNLLRHLTTSHNVSNIPTDTEDPNIIFTAALDDLKDQLSEKVDSTDIPLINSKLDMLQKEVIELRQMNIKLLENISNECIGENTSGLVILSNNVNSFNSSIDNSVNKTVNDNRVFNITYNITFPQDNYVKINTFGNENTSYITDEYMHSLLQLFFKELTDNPPSLHLKYIEDVHFNPQYPENMNIKLKSLKDRTTVEVKVNDNIKDSWQDFNIKEFADKLIIRAFGVLMGFLKNNPDAVIPKPTKTEVVNIRKGAISHYQDEIDKLNGNYEYDIEYNLLEYIQKKIKSKKKEYKYFMDQIEQLKKDNDYYGEGDLTDDIILERFLDDKNLSIDLHDLKQYYSVKNSRKYNTEKYKHEADKKTNLKKLVITCVEHYDKIKDNKNKEERYKIEEYKKLNN
jgi:hypothetical protein